MRRVNSTSCRPGRFGLLAVAIAAGGMLLGAAAPAVAGGSWNSSLFTFITESADSNGFSLTSKRPDSSFQIVDLSGDLVLEYVVVPEPGTLALAGLGLAVAAWGYRRRRNAQRRLW